MVSLTVILVSFFITYLIMPKVISYSIKKEFFDNPGRDQLKIHEMPIPYMGGIGIFTGFFLPLIYVCYVSESPAKLLGVLIGSMLIVILGLWDDMKNIKPFMRIGVQLLAAFLPVYLGLRIEAFPDYISIPLSIAVIIGCINAVNLFDGLDGLAGGVVSISLIGFGILFHMQENSSYLIISVGLLGAVLGFLPYNFNPARVFMGDNGSTFLGYMIAILAINASSVPHNVVLFAGSLILIGLPVIDILLAITRRFLSGKPIFIGDRSHMYDWLVDKGYSIKKTALICYSMQILLVSSGLFLLYISSNKGMQ